MCYSEATSRNAEFESKLQIAEVRKVTQDCFIDVLTKRLEQSEENGARLRKVLDDYGKLILTIQNEIERLVNLISVDFEADRIVHEVDLILVMPSRMILLLLLRLDVVLIENLPEILLPISFSFHPSSFFMIAICKSYI